MTIAVDMGRKATKTNKLTCESKQGGKDQQSIQLSTTPDQGHHMESYINARKHHTQESQEVSPFPADDNKAAMNRQESMTNTKHK